MDNVQAFHPTTCPAIQLGSSLYSIIFPNQEALRLHEAIADELNVIYNPWTDRWQTWCRSDRTNRRHIPQKPNPKGRIPPHKYRGISGPWFGRPLSHETVTRLKRAEELLGLDRGEDLWSRHRLTTNAQKPRARKPPPSPLLLHAPRRKKRRPTLSPNSLRCSMLPTKRERLWEELTDLERATNTMSLPNAGASDSMKDLGLLDSPSGLFLSPYMAPIKRPDDVTWFGNLPPTPRDHLLTPVLEFSSRATSALSPAVWPLREDDFEPWPEGFPPTPHACDPLTPIQDSGPVLSLVSPLTGFPPTPQAPPSSFPGEGLFFPSYVSSVREDDAEPWSGGVPPTPYIPKWEKTLEDDLGRSDDWELSDDIKSPNELEPSNGSESSNNSELSDYSDLSDVDYAFDELAFEILDHNSWINDEMPEKFGVLLPGKFMRSYRGCSEHGSIPKCPNRDTLLMTCIWQQMKFGVNDLSGRHRFSIIENWNVSSLALQEDSLDAWFKALMSRNHSDSVPVRFKKEELRELWSLVYHYRRDFTLVVPYELALSLRKASSKEIFMDILRQTPGPRPIFVWSCHPMEIAVVLQTILDTYIEGGCLHRCYALGGRQCYQILRNIS